jgi:carboxylesterase type B
MQNNFTQFVFNNPAPVEGEDCLHLNIFAPPDATPERLKPVMFWIYGVRFPTPRCIWFPGR